MKPILELLHHAQRLIVPAIILLTIWAAWRTVVRRDMGVALALYLGLVIFVDGFWNTGIPLPGLQSGTIRYSEACALLLMINRPAALLLTPAGRRIRALVVIYFLLLVASIFRADSPVAAILEFRNLIVPQMMATFIALRGLRTEEDYRRFFRGVSAIVLIIGLFDLWDILFDTWILHSDVLLTPDYTMNRHKNRFGSVFLNPNYMGAFAVLVFPALFVATLNENARWARILGWSGLMGLLFCLVETQSRGPMLAFGVMVPLLVFGPCGGMSRTRRVTILTAALLLFMVAMPGFIDHALQRFNDPSLEVETTATVARSRESVWLYSQKVIRDHPWAGVGFGEKQFVLTMERYGFNEQYGEQSLDNPHNSYLQAMVYAGIPAVAAFLLANLLLLWRGAAASLRRDAGSTGPVVFGLAVGITGFLTAIYPDMHLFTRNVAPVYWVFFALLFALAARTAPAAVAKPGRTA